MVMKYALEERIGDPDLFTGRKNELYFFPDRIEDIKKRKSQRKSQSKEECIPI
jgi:hypothetical protein